MLGHSSASKEVCEKKCNLHHKIARGLPLSEGELRLLGTIIREELKFLLRNNILPTPKNYEKWFMVFCLVHEQWGQMPSDEELIKLYHNLYTNEKISDVKLDVGLALDMIAKLVKDFHELVREHGEYASRKERELSNMEEEFSRGELVQILMELLEHVRGIKAHNEKYMKRIEEQQQMIEDLRFRLEQAEAEANMDYLTHTFNRRSFERALADSLEEYKRSRVNFSLVIIDLDRFKAINDLYGHSVGDLVLKRIAYILRQNLRARDILARWGGDEFAIIMPGTGKDKAIDVVERLREAVKNTSLVVEGQRLSLSFSYGVVEAMEGYSSVEDMLKEADRLMYEYKKGKAS
ncbi:MAG: GGDEF domain-containing protein [Aquificaceae bacterium]|nr:GGDEF domain-containing protein [Aquificaceae bacterium]